MTFQAKPFVKWAGGKTQLLDEIRKHYPARIEKYSEPFVGGGAVLFDVLQKSKPQKVLINDINPNLVNTYEQVKSNLGELCEKLSQLQNQYYGKSEEEQKSFFYEKRNRFNEIKLNENNDIGESKIEKAALFIFLNKTCFNGLYRVNKKGFFNVPWNRAKSPLIFDEENLRACSALLQNVEITCGDYKTCANFCDNEQIELEKFVAEISEKGAKVLVSNSDPKNVDEKDEFFDELYSAFDIERISAARMINSNAKKRGKVNELLITNVKSLKTSVFSDFFENAMF